MKKMNKVFSAVASLMLTLAIAGCTAQDIQETVVPETTVEQATPAAASTQVTIPFKVQVVSADTKVTIDANQKYVIQKGDQLSISGVDRNVTGTLTYKDQNGNISFEGEITYDKVEGEFKDDTRLQAVLFNKDNVLDFDYAKAVTSDLTKAVEQFSRFTASFKANDDKIALSQSSSFLVFDLSFVGNTAWNASDAGVSVSDDSNAIEATGKVEVKEGKASFVVAVPSGVEPKNPVVEMGGKTVAFTGKKLEPSKSYTIKRSILPSAGDPYYSDGTWGVSSHTAGKEVVGIIVFVNRGKDSAHPGSCKTDADIIKYANSVTENKTALVMALHDAGGDASASWSTATNASIQEKDVKSPEDALYSCAGRELTQTMLDHIGINAANGKKDDKATYPAATLVTEYNPAGTTGWFLPASGQWMSAIFDFGGADDESTWLNDDGGKWRLGDVVCVKWQGTPVIDVFNAALATYGGTALTGGSNPKWVSYWTSSEYDNGKAIRMNFGISEKHPVDHPSCIKLKQEQKKQDPEKQKSILRVRPFRVF